MRPDREVDETAIRRWHQELEDSVNNADDEGYMSHWVEDMIWLPPNMHPLYGKQECLRMFKGGEKQYGIQQKVSVEEVVVSGDLAFSWVNSQYLLTPKGDAEAMINDGKTFFTFKRGSNGSWLGVHCMWNSNIPPEASVRFDKLIE